MAAVLFSRLKSICRDSVGIFKFCSVAGIGKQNERFLCWEGIGLASTPYVFQSECLGFVLTHANPSVGANAHRSGKHS